MPALVAIEKDVQDQLLRTRSCRRKPGAVPYPFEYNNGMVDFDIWEHMLFVSSFHGLTLHQFEQPPQVVLDLGCGGGYWAIEAAKQWPSSNFIGFDIANVQPNLQDLEHHRHLARRVKWAHGNLLDGLPFPSSQFDFVRIAYIGLGVPEDEWQFVLEEISRVMKPGATLELIEEDPIFPCTTLPLEPLSLPHLTDFDSSLRGLNSSSSSTLLNTSSTFPERRQPASPLKTKFQELTRSKTASKGQLAQLLSDSSFSSQASSSSKDGESLLIQKHPQDHTRLKAAWDLMLSSRFLPPKLLTVLPFYLSTYFEVESHPQVKIYLPPNSNSLPPLRARHSAESFRPSSRENTDHPFDMTLPTISLTFYTDDGSLSSLYSARNSGSSHRWTTMHLSRTVNTAAACKAPIRQEYEKLFYEEYLEQYSHSDVTFEQVFDRDWNSWHNDMNDRMNMRERMDMSLSWPDTPGARPDCQKWRSDFHHDPHSLSPHKGPPPKMYYDSSDLCRSLRAFIGKKPL